MTRLVLLVTSPAVRPGLLSWPAWQLLHGAGRVLAPARDHPLLPALEEAGIGWEVLPGAGTGHTGRAGWPGCSTRGGGRRRRVTSCG